MMFVLAEAGERFNSAAGEALAELGRDQAPSQELPVGHWVFGVSWRWPGAGFSWKICFTGIPSSLLVPLFAFPAPTVARDKLHLFL